MHEITFRWKCINWKMILLRICNFFVIFFSISKSFVINTANDGNDWFLDVNCLCLCHLSAMLLQSHLFFIFNFQQYLDLTFITIFHCCCCYFLFTLNSTFTYTHKIIRKSEIELETFIIFSLKERIKLKTLNGD